jgi:uncharacterized protein (DUF927 family)
MEGAAAVHTDTLLALDELGVVDAKEAGTAAYQLAAGTGKGRLNKESALRSSLTWRVLMLSTGELAMATKLEEDRGRKAQAGQQVRMLDIAADAGKGFGAFDSAGPQGNPAKLADAIKQAAQTAYGTAGPAFVSAVVEAGPLEIGTKVNALVEVFKQAHVPAGADGQVNRAATRLGLIAAAGELAVEFGVLPWEAGLAAAAAARALTDWINCRGGVESAEVRAMVSQVRRFIEIHGDARFEPASTKPERPVPNRAGWWRGDGTSREWLIPPEIWKSEICHGLDPTVSAKTLADKGMLKRPKDGYQRVERIHGNSQRVYVLTAAIFDGFEP